MIFLAELPCEEMSWRCKGKHVQGLHHLGMRGVGRETHNAKVEPECCLQQSLLSQLVICDGETYWWIIRTWQ